MPFLGIIRCRKCGAEFPRSAPCRCPKCGGAIEINYDYQAIANTISPKILIARQQGVWKYAELLPLRTEDRVTLGEGGTRLIRSKGLAEAVGLKNLFIKNETRNPTGSFKDRCSTVSISKALESRARGIVIASSGNAAASACAYSSQAEIPCYVFVPPETGISKLVRIDIFGGRAVKVSGPVDNCLTMAQEAASRHGWVNVTTNSKANPYTLEGTKTAAYEVCESMGWECPDYFALPVGSGACLTGHWRGFRDLMKLGFVDDPPHIVAVQSAGCAPFASAIRAGLGSEGIKVWENPKTIASGITDAFPSDGDGAYQAIEETDGLVEIVSDSEIIEAQIMLAKKEGIFAEPTGAVSLAGLIKLLRSGQIDANDVVACEITGHGLNDIEPTAARTGEVPEIQPTMEDFERALSKHRDAV